MKIGPNPLKVMILVDKFDYHGSYINGPCQYFSWIVPAINRVRFAPFLCALRSPGRSDAVLRREGVDVDYFRLGKFDPSTLLRITQYVRRNQIDLLHLTGYGSTTFGRLAARLCGKPAIVHEHWVDAGIGTAQRGVERVLGAWTDWGIAISETAKRFLVEKKHLRPERVEIIPNGIPLARFVDMPEDAGRAKRRELGIPQDAPVIGTVGMFHEVKGHRYLLDAAASVAESFPQAVFLIIGDGELRGTLEERIRGNSRLTNVRLLGHREDVPALLRAMDVYVCASISETFSLSLLEAMASGRAVVTTDCGGPGEMIRDGWSGYLVPIRDPGAMAERIASLLEDASKRAAFGRNAVESAMTYDIRTTVSRLESLYERACDRPAGSRGRPGRAGEGVAGNMN